ERAQEGALARAVGADDRHHFAGAERRQAEALDDGAAAIAGAEVLDVQPAHARPPLRKISTRKTGTPITAVTMPTGISTPGTMILDAAEASDMMTAPDRMLAGRKKR